MFVVGFVGIFAHVRNFLQIWDHGCDCDPDIAPNPCSVAVSKSLQRVHVGDRRGTVPQLPLVIVLVLVLSGRN